jgi:hypothetical protein
MSSRTPAALVDAGAHVDARLAAGDEHAAKYF